MRNYLIFLNVVATIIVAIAVGGILIISFNYLSIPEENSQLIKIDYQSVDSIKVNSEIKKLDSLLVELKNTSNKINLEQQQLIKDKTDDNFFNKLYTAIVAIILAIAGFFGFKSISEIKSQALEDAKSEASKIAKNTAKSEFKKIFSAEYEAHVFNISMEAMNRLLLEEIGELESRIAILEQNRPVGNDMQNDNDGQPQNPFDNE